MPTLDELQKGLRSFYPWRRRATVEALAACGADAVPHLVHALRDRSANVRRAAVLALGEVGAADAVGPLAGALDDTDAQVRATATLALRKLGPPAARALTHAVADGWTDVRVAAAQALGTLGEPEARASLVRALCDHEPAVRAASARALAELGDVKAIVPLVGALADSSPDVRAAAAAAISGARPAAGVVGQLRAMASGERLDHPETAGRGLLDSAEPDDALRGAIGSALSATAGRLLSLLDFERTKAMRLGALDTRACRDAIQMLHELQEPRAIEPIVRMLWIPTGGLDEPPLQGDALRALADLGCREAAEAILREALAVSGYSSFSMVHRRDVLADPEVARFLAGSPDVAVDAILRRLPEDEAWEGRAGTIVAHLEDDALARNVLRTLREHREATGVRLERLAALHPDLRERLIAAWAAMPIDVQQKLSGLLNYRAPWVRIWAAEALGRTGSADAQARFRKTWAARFDAYDRLAAAVGLAWLGDASGLHLLISSLTGAYGPARFAAARALGRLGLDAVPALDALREGASDYGTRFADACRAAIEEIQRARREAPAELLFAPAPHGSGIELEAAARPAGSGAEPEAADHPTGPTAG